MQRDLLGRPSFIPPLACRRLCASLLVYQLSKLHKMVRGTAQ
jgi:hypothetical protein